MGPGWPDLGETFPGRECLPVVLSEEWWHRVSAEHDRPSSRNKTYLVELVLAGPMIETRGPSAWPSRLGCSTPSDCDPAGTLMERG